MNLRQERLNGLLKDLAAEFMQNQSSGVSLITITDADVSKDLQRSTIFFTVYPEDKEKEALDFTKRKRTDFREYVKSKMHIRRIPFFDFQIDMGEKNRQKIDELLRNS